MAELNIGRLSEYKVVAPDVETTGLHWYTDKVFGIALAALQDDGRVVSDYFDIREKPRVVEVLARELPRCKLVVNHHIKFDAHFLRETGIQLPMDRLGCTSVRAALINEHEPSFSLDALGLKYLKEGKVDIWAELAKLFGGAPTRAIQIKNLHRAPVSLAARYAAPDPALALKLWLWQEKEIKKQDLQQVWDLERRLLPVLVDIEQHGIRIDERRTRAALKGAIERTEQAQAKLNRLVDKVVNVNSSPQMHALFDADSVDKEFLRKKMVEGGKKGELAGLVIDVRKYTKGQSFLKDHILGHLHRGRVHCNYNQTRGGDNELGTGTGRFSIDDPALQQIPIRDRDIAELVRPCFVPDTGEVWGRSDWDQFEFRWFAHYLEDPKITGMYDANPDSDFHQVVSDLTGIPRDPEYAGGPAAKRINLGLVFGMGAGTMAAEMRMDFTIDERGYYHPGPKAKELFDKYHENVPGVKALLSKASSIAKARGYVRTVGGRHIRFPKGMYSHKAGGLVFQGSSADCMKMKMIEEHAWCKPRGIHILLSVHDELDFSIPKPEVKQFKIAMKHHLETFDGVVCPIRCDIPIRASITTGPNWWETSK